MANWRCGPLSRVINTRLPTSPPSALSYWARIPERQFPTVRNILHAGSAMYRKGQPLEREAQDVRDGPAWGLGLAVDLGAAAIATTSIAALVLAAAAHK